MKKIKGVLITPKNNSIKVYELEEKSFEDYYPLLECETFDIQTRKFNGEYLDIYCDDEGLFKEGNKPSIITFDNGKIVEQIVGNVFIVGHNNEGQTISLTDEQIYSVLSNVRKVTTMSPSGEKEVLTVCFAEI